MTGNIPATATLPIEKKNETKVIAYPPAISSMNASTPKKVISKIIAVINDANTGLHFRIFQNHSPICRDYIKKSVERQKIRSSRTSGFPFLFFQFPAYIIQRFRFNFLAKFLFSAPDFNRLINTDHLLVILID